MVTRLFGLLTGALVYYGAANLSIALFSLEPSNIALIWLPSGIGLVMCGTWGWSALPFIFVASFTANAPGMTPVLDATHLSHTAVAALANTLESVVA